MAFRCISLREKELRRNKDRLAIVRSAHNSNIILGPNETINIKGYTDKEIDHQHTNAMLQETEESNIPSYIDVTPTVIQYNNRKNTEMLVNLSNLTTNTVVISPKAILCELQPVKIDRSSCEDNKEKHQTSENILEEIHIETNLPEDQEAQIKELIMKHKDIFSKDDTDIGLCEGVKHRIDLLDETPFKQRHRRIPPHMIDELRDHLEQLLASGVIRRSKSPWCSNVVLVRKKTGKLRMCIDYRMLNEKTIKDSYALPRIEEVFDVLHGAKVFSVIDMKSGYHQVEMEEEHKDRTAFTVGPLGFFEYIRMPFGLSNSPSTYQRLMEDCLGDYNMKICVIYLDDLIIFADSFEQHLERLDMILTRLRECQLKLSAEKCFLIQKRVKFLGHVVSEYGIETDPDKIEKVKNWPIPDNSDELRSFLAFAGYYRRFVKDFSKITRPLSDLLPPTTKKRNRAKEQKEWSWTEKEQEVFDQLKSMLTSPPILSFPNFEEPFELHTDAFTKGLGAVLYNIQESQKKVVAYASRSLSKSEKNYSVYKLEHVALKWSITEKFSDYLLGKQFTVLTSNYPLTYVLTSAKLDATGQRWASALGQYNFNILNRPGIKNQDADGMSRYPYEKLKDDQIKIDDNIVKAICCSMTAIPPYVETLPNMNINIIQATETPGQPMAQIEVREIRKQQREDKIIGKWVRAVMDKKMPNKKIHLTKDDLNMKKNFDNLKMIRGLLYRVIKDKEETINQLIMPECYRNNILQGIHNELGHPGKDRTLSLLRERYFWPWMNASVDNWVTKCDRCLRRKTSTNIRAEMTSIVTTYPLELVSMDYLTLEPSKGGQSNILVITDHFTKYAIAVPTHNQTAKTTADAFYDNFAVHYGIPTRIHSDQGANFESDLIKELCNLTGMTKSKTTAYHPMGNGCTERWNRTLLDMLGTLETDKKANWKKYIPSLAHAYNCTKHESTKFAPFELMFGRKPKLPIDSVFENTYVTSTMSKNTKEYIFELKDKMKATQEIVQEHSNIARQKQKQQFDKKAKASKIDIGDKVLVKILAFEGKHKIADKFEQDVYEVVEQQRPNIPVFRVRSNNGVEKVLHRNHLLPIETGVCIDKPILPTPKKRTSLSKQDVITEEVSDKGAPADTSNKGNKDTFSLEEVDDKSEESEEESGNVYVRATYTHRDDYTPGKGIVTEAEMSQSDNEEDYEIENAEVISDVASTEDTDEVDQEMEEIVEEIHTEMNDADQIVVQNNIDTEDDVNTETQENDKNNSIELDTSETRVTPKPKLRDKKKIPVPRQDSTEQQEQPAVVPRRSERSRKPPEWTKSYQMNQITTRPYDSKLHALDVVMNSGILNNLDVEVTHKILDAIIK